MTVEVTDFSSMPSLSVLNFHAFEPTRFDVDVNALLPTRREVKMKDGRAKH